jgi:hypothetical protein
VRRAQQLDEPQPGPAVHFSPEALGYPLCGARWGAPWAMNFDAVTCRACREQGWTVQLQHDVNTR